MEIEPIRYELEIRSETDDSASRRPTKTTRQDVVLAKSSLFRFEEGRDVEARLQKVLTYQYEKSEYFGQVRPLSVKWSCSLLLMLATFDQGRSQDPIVKIIFCVKFYSTMEFDQSEKPQLLM